MKSDNHPTERRILRSEDESIDLEGVGTKCKNEDLALVDSISLYTLKMLKDSRYYVQHPYFRIFVAYFVVFCNFLIYAEDPVAHSVSECSLPVLGNAFSFVVIRWPDIAGYTILKAFMATLFLGCGMIFGKYIIHKRFLSGYLRFVLLLYICKSLKTIYRINYAILCSITIIFALSLHKRNRFLLIIINLF